MLKFLLLMLILSAVPVSASVILEVCPNPYDPNSEYVKVFVDSNCTLTDGEGSITFNRTGTFYVAKNSTAFERSFGFPPDYEFEGRFALSNSGEKVWIVKNGKVVDEFEWRNADKGLIYYRTDRGWDFRYEDWTDFDSVRDYVSGKVIVSPANYRIKADSIVLASYTLTDPDAIDCDNVTIFLDGNPVGGVPLNEKFLNATFLKSRSYKHFHWKFAVADGSKVIITTENWNFDKRGYIVEFESEKIAKYLLSVLDHDKRYRCSVKSFSKPRLSVKSLSAGKIAKFESQVEVFVLPDRNPVLEFMMSAKRRLLIQAPYMGVEWEPLLNTIENVSKRVETKIILDENDVKTKEFLEKLAKSKNLKLEVRTMRHLHGKMIVADDVVLITSANLNEYGLKLNREVGIKIYDKKIADFLADSFDEDWNSDEGNSYHLLVVATVLALSLLLIHRRLR